MKLRKESAIIAMLLVVLIASCKKRAEVGIRPTVTSTDPINKATSTGISSQVTVIFSVAMDPSSLTAFTLYQGATSVSGTVESTGTTATFTPAANLTPNTVYTATITTGAKNMSGRSLAKDYVWTFTTGAIPDTTSPTVASTDPANNATGVATNHTVTATFSEAMDPTAITSGMFTVKQGSTPVSGVVTYTGTTATFTPASNLAGNKTYTATITKGAKDLGGNALAISHVFSFATGDAPDVTLPSVNSTDPLNNTTGIARDKTVGITFSEAMAPLTITAST